MPPTSVSGLITKLRVMGRIKLGTESNGGFRNITISNCVVDDCRGIALETVDGGLLEDVSISNIKMRDITNVSFFMRLGARMRGPEGTPVGYLRRVLVSNVLVSNADSRQSALITGIPGHNIEDVKFSNVCIEHQGGGTKDSASSIPPENETGYPEPNRFGPMPAQGFFIRHVKGIEMRDVEIRSLREDSRPAFVLEDVNSAEFIHAQCEGFQNLAEWNHTRHLPGTGGAKDAVNPSKESNFFN